MIGEHTKKGTNNCRSINMEVKETMCGTHAYFNSGYGGFMNVG